MKNDRRIFFTVCGIIVILIVTGIILVTMADTTHTGKMKLEYPSDYSLMVHFKEGNDRYHFIIVDNEEVSVATLSYFDGAHCTIEYEIIDSMRFEEWNGSTEYWYAIKILNIY